MRVHIIYIVVLGALLLLSGCEAARKRERDRVAVAYADVMIAEQRIRGDSLARLRLIDSVLKSYGYKSRAELQAAFRGAADEPELMRQMLDSAQKRIENVQLGKTK